MLYIVQFDHIWYRSPMISTATKRLVIEYVVYIYYLRIRT